MALSVGQLNRQQQQSSWHHAERQVCCCWDAWQFTYCGAVEQLPAALQHMLCLVNVPAATLTNPVAPLCVWMIAPQPQAPAPFLTPHLRQAQATSQLLTGLTSQTVLQATPSHTAVQVRRRKLCKDGVLAAASCRAGHARLTRTSWVVRFTSRGPTFRTLSAGGTSPPDTSQQPICSPE